VSVSDIFRFENSRDETKNDALMRCYRDSTSIDIASRERLINWRNNSQGSCCRISNNANQVISVDIDSMLSEVSAIVIKNDVRWVFITQNERASVEFPTWVFCAA